MTTTMCHFYYIDNIEKKVGISVFKKISPRKFLKFQFETKFETTIFSCLSLQISSYFFLLCMSYSLRVCRAKSRTENMRTNENISCLKTGKTLNPACFYALNFKPCISFHSQTINLSTEISNAFRGSNLKKGLRQYGLIRTKLLHLVGVLDSDLKLHFFCSKNRVLELKKSLRKLKL